jgi:hypothetical protein
MRLKSTQCADSAVLCWFCRWDSSAASVADTEASGASGRDLASSSIGSSSSLSSSRYGSGSGYSVDSELAQQQEKQQAVLEAYGTPGQPSQLALLCFEDVIQPGVPTTVQQLQSGSWSDAGGLWGRRAVDAPKDVIMLTGWCLLTCDLECD